jgi:hypothetical protein
MKPYVGIADFSNRQQAQEAFDFFNKNKPEGLDLLFHVGVMMSYKTFYGIPTEWEAIFPKKEEIAKIFFSEKAYNCLHYVDYRGRPNFADSLDRVISFGGKNIKAIQLDMTWPDPVEIRNGNKGRVEVILQIGRKAFKEIDENIVKMIKRLEKYQGIVHRVLLDKSMGEGKPMNPCFFMPFVRAIKINFPEIGIGGAGGLGPETAYKIVPLLKIYSSLSSDAQGQLRSSGNIKEPLELDRVKIFLFEMIKIHSSFHSHRI